MWAHALFHVPTIKEWNRFWKASLLRLVKMTRYVFASVIVIYLECKVKLITIDLDLSFLLMSCKSTFIISLDSIMLAMFSYTHTATHRYYDFFRYYDIFACIREKIRRNQLRFIGAIYGAYVSFWCFFQLCIECLQVHIKFVPRVLWFCEVLTHLFSRGVRVVKADPNEIFQVDTK